MKGPANTMIGSMAVFLVAVWVAACTSVQEQPKPTAPAVAQQPAPAKKEEPRKPEAQNGDKSNQESGRGGRCDQQRRAADYHFSA